MEKANIKDFIQEKKDEDLQEILDRKEEMLIEMQIVPNVYDTAVPSSGLDLYLGKEKIEPKNVIDITYMGKSYMLKLSEKINLIKKNNIGFTIQELLDNCVNNFLRVKLQINLGQNSHLLKRGIVKREEIEKGVYEYYIKDTEDERGYLFWCNKYYIEF